MYHISCELQMHDLSNLVLNQVTNQTTNTITTCTCSSMLWKLHSAMTKACTYAVVCCLVNTGCCEANVCVWKPISFSCLLFFFRGFSLPLGGPLGGAGAKWTGWLCFMLPAIPTMPPFLAPDMGGNVWAEAIYAKSLEKKRRKIKLKHRLLTVSFTSNYQVHVHCKLNGEYTVAAIGVRLKSSDFSYVQLQFSTHQTTDSQVVLQIKCRKGCEARIEAHLLE